MIHFKYTSGGLRYSERISGVHMVEAMATKRINITWADRDEEAIRIIHEELKRQGVFFERDGEPNVSAIIDYILVQKAREIEKGRADDV